MAYSFDRNFFVAQTFAPADLERFRNSALRDIEIARTDDQPEVKFHFTYMALIKAGVFCAAKAGYRVKSKPGHHQKILEALSRLTGDEDIQVVGDKMRRDRNADLYPGFFTEKSAPSGSEGLRGQTRQSLASRARYPKF